MDILDHPSIGKKSIRGYLLFGLITSIQTAKQKIIFEIVRYNVIMSISLNMQYVSYKLDRATQLVVIRPNSNSHHSNLDHFGSKETRPIRPGM